MWMLSFAFMTLFGRNIKNIEGFCKCLILLAALIWGLSFVIMKDAVEVVEPSWLLGIRFTATGLILVVVFFKRLRTHFNRDHIVFGVALGIMLSAGFLLQTMGLVYTTPGKNAFLTACYVVITPFAYWLFVRKRPTVFHLVAAVVCLAGMGFVSLQESLSIGFGEALTIMSALLYAIHFVFVAKWSRKYDVLVLTVYQFLAMGLLGFGIGIIFEPAPAIETLLDTTFLLNMTYLVIFASCIALVIQNFALKYVSPSQASLFLSFEAVFGVIFSVWLCGEILTLRLIIGFCLIFLAIVISETFPLKGLPWRKKQQGPANLEETT